MTYSGNGIIENSVCNFLEEQDPSYSQEEFTTHVNAVKCFQRYDEIGEFSVEQILNKFIGKWETRDAYVEVALLEHCVEEMIQEITIPCPTGGVPMFLECLDYDKVWETMSQMETVLKGYVNIWSENNPDFDHCFYVYDMTR